MPEGGRSVLVVAYYFPPWGGGPVMRTVKLVKYLQRLGWSITVLTADPRYYESISDDPELMDEIGNAVRVVRTHSLQPVGRIARDLMNQSTGQSSGGIGFARRILPLARAAHQLLIPDDKVLWLPFAFVTAARLVRRCPPDVVYVTTPPHSTGLLGVLMKYLMRRQQLIVDIRDDWIGNPLYRRGWRLRAWIEERLERCVLHQAAAILVPTEGARCAVVTRHRALADRVHVVPNGFDEDDIDRARGLESFRPACSAALECIYTGLLTGRRSMTALFASIKRVNDRVSGSVQLSVAGFVPQDTRDAISRIGVSGAVQELGYLPHVTALRRVLDSDVAVLVSTEGEGARTAVPSKLYEYVACSKPVLALADPGATRDLVEENDWGSTCDPDDVDAIERALLDLLDRKRNASLAVSKQALDRVAFFSRQSLASRTAAIMETTLT